MTGIDLSQSTVGKAHLIAGRGYGFVIRYLSPDTPNHPTKQITKAELAGLHAAGLAVGLVWEIGDTVDGYTAALGTAHADRIVMELAALGATPGQVCPYVAVDFDASPSQAAGPVSEYFASLRHRLRATTNISNGVYGSGSVLTILSMHGLADLKWLAQSTGWSGSKGYTGYHIIQGPGATACGLNVDIDHLHPNFTPEQCGLWMP